MMFLLVFLAAVLAYGITEFIFSFVFKDSWTKNTECKEHKDNDSED